MKSPGGFTRRPVRGFRNGRTMTIKGLTLSPNCGGPYSGTDAELYSLSVSMSPCGQRL